MILGRHSFHRKSLHAISNTPNPYEQAISIIGRTLSPFDEDNLIPCFGFGDGQYLFITSFQQKFLVFTWNSYLMSFLSVASTHDKYVFSFYPDHRYCRGFEEVLARYKEIVPYLKLSGFLQLLFTFPCSMQFVYQFKLSSHNYYFLFCFHLFLSYFV